MKIKSSQKIKLKTRFSHSLFNLGIMRCIFFNKAQAGQSFETPANHAPNIETMIRSKNIAMK
jgi:hypothetical protein